MAILLRTWLKKVHFAVGRDTEVLVASGFLHLSFMGWSFVKVMPQSLLSRKINFGRATSKAPATSPAPSMKAAEQSEKKSSGEAPLMADDSKENEINFYFLCDFNNSFEVSSSSDITPQTPPSPTSAQNEQNDKLKDKSKRRRGSFILNSSKKKALEEEEREEQARRGSGPCCLINAGYIRWVLLFSRSQAMLSAVLVVGARSAWAWTYLPWKSCVERTGTACRFLCL